MDSCLSCFTAVDIIHSAVFLYIFMIYAYIAMFSAIAERQMTVVDSEKELTGAEEKKGTGSVSWFFAAMVIIFVCCWFSYFIVMLSVNKA